MHTLDTGVRVFVGYFSGNGLYCAYPRHRKLGGGKLCNGPANRLVWCQVQGIATQIAQVTMSTRGNRDQSHRLTAMLRLVIGRDQLTSQKITR